MLAPPKWPYIGQSRLLSTQGLLSFTVDMILGSPKGHVGCYASDVVAGVAARAAKTAEESSGMAAEACIRRPGVRGEACVGRTDSGPEGGLLHAPVLQGRPC